MTRSTATPLGPTRRAPLGTGAGVLASVGTPAFAADRLVYRDASAPVAGRVRDLLSRMTTEEKVAQLGAFWIGKFGIFDKDGVFSLKRAAMPLGNGMRQITRPSDTISTVQFRTKRFRSLEDAVETANAVQRFLVEKTRLGIPALFHEEPRTAWSPPMRRSSRCRPALASTWDPALVEQVFTVAARQGAHARREDRFRTARRSQSCRRC